MGLNPEEVSAILRKEIDRFESKLETASVGVVLQVGDGIARVWGLRDVMMSELVTFPGNVTGFVLNLEADNVGVAILGNYQGIKEGDLVHRTKKVSQVPVGKGLWGRVINPLGEPLDGDDPIAATSFRLLESGAPNVVERQPVKEPLQTGLRAVDSMIPIGRGQRELIIGDRQTGKTAIAIDAIINQKGANVHCIYVAIGQKASSVARVVEILKQHGAMEYTTVVSATANDPAPMQYIAPYAGCAIGEDSMYNGGHALVIYDDLSKHAQAYRQLSLLLRRPPGREAYPGDIFYCHSRLLERAAKLNEDRGGGSLTALPIIETQAGDVSAYIPTNVISITDGQIYLEPDLFFAGTRPAINVGISVSRVGGKAQTKAMKSVASILRLELAQYRELEAFARFGAELDASTRKQLARGERMVEILKQGQYKPEALSGQVIAIWAGVNGQFDDIPVPRLRLIEPLFFDYVQAVFSRVVRAIDTDKLISDATEADLKTAADAIWGFHLTIQWLAGEKKYVAMIPAMSVRRFEDHFSHYLINRIAEGKIPDILRAIGANDKIDEKSEHVLDEEAKLFLPLFIAAEIVGEKKKDLIAAKIAISEFTAAFAEYFKTAGRGVLDLIMTQKKYSDEAKQKLHELFAAFQTGYKA